MSHRRDATTQEEFADAQGENLIEPPFEVRETVTAAPAKVLLLRIVEKGRRVTVRMSK